MSHSSLTLKVFIAFLEGMNFKRGNTLSDDITDYFFDPKSKLKIIFDKDVKILSASYVAFQITRMMEHSFSEGEISKQLALAKKLNRK